MEFAFELAICSHLEETTDWLPGRQLGAAVETPGRRIVDVCAVEPGPEFESRAAITERTIPPRAVESEVGPGEAVYWKDAFDCHPDVARRVTDRAVDAGFFEAERRRGRRYVRQATRYPDWIGRLVGIENKPDLGSPGDLQRQLRIDVSLGLFDAVVLATESYVTGAHLNRIPEAVGVWRFDPETGERTVVRDPTPLSVASAGVEPVDFRSLRTDVTIVSAAAKARARRRLAERVYGSGWRPALPDCARLHPTGDGRPYCSALDRVVDPGSDCGADCPHRDPTPAPEIDRDGIRAARTPWVADPDGVARRQAGLDRFP
ncbi:DUF5787 family protein [Salinirarus marinus]|uniref:DUF5787 family protein n=1 Tax=Salinirarus marinus TaxID=3068310 RepID=UPI003C6CB6BC